MYAKNEPTNSNVHPKLLLMEVMPSQKPYPSQHGQQLQHLFITQVSERVARAKVRRVKREMRLFSNVLQ